MYLPLQFAEIRLDAVRLLLKHTPLSALVVNEPNGFDTNHLPFELDKKTQRVR